MEFLFYIVACFGVMAVCFPLFSIATSLERLTSVMQEGDRELVRAHVRADETYDSHGRQRENRSLSNRYSGDPRGDSHGSGSRNA